MLRVQRQSARLKRLQQQREAVVQQIARPVHSYPTKSAAKRLAKVQTEVFDAACRLDDLGGCNFAIL